MNDLQNGGSRSVVVDSPPGAGKSTFVVEAAQRLSELSAVPIISQTNSQADDLVRKALSRTDLTVGRLHGGTPPNLDPHPRLLTGNRIGDVNGADVIVSTSAKWAYVDDTNFPIAIIDEAYQMRSDQLFYLGGLFDRALLVGDPGQLDPFTPVDDGRWRGQIDGPVSPAVATVLNHHPDTPVHRLPVSWRLSGRCAPLISDAFYPTMPFRSGTSPTERSLSGSAGDGSAIDAAIDGATANGWSFLELSEKILPVNDHEAIGTLARTVIRILQRNFEASDQADDSGAIRPDRIAIGVAHRAQRAAARMQLDELGAAACIDTTGVTVDTANRLQGREYHVVVVLHPLSGRAAASEFHLETGRLCVLLSRHRHVCIVVGRVGITELLDTHPLSTPIWLGAPIPVPDGWEANQIVMEELRKCAVKAD